MDDITYVLKVVFYLSETGNEPVREWLKDLPREDKRQVGEDIKEKKWCQFQNWP